MDGTFGMNGALLLLALAIVTLVGALIFGFIQRRGGYKARDEQHHSAHTDNPLNREAAERERAR